MVTDPIFYRLFETSPETLFLMLGMSAKSAKAMAARYSYQALEFKETSQRVDGVFLPQQPNLPVYFLEVQFYPLPNVYAGLLAKVFTYLKQHQPSQPFRGVVLFASRALEPTELAPYQALLDSGQIQRYYLDEMPLPAKAPLGLSILHLIRQSESRASAMAGELVARAKTEIGDVALRSDLIELIETVIIYRLPHLSREEVQTMLKIHDIRESRIYQEALQEGREEGKAEGIEEGRIKGEKDGKKKGKKEGKKKGKEAGIAFAIAKMAAKNMSAEEIAAILELDLERVRQAMTKAK